jgi:integrase
MDRMAVRKRANSWQYDFKLQGYARQRKAGFKTRAEAREAERRAREDLISGRKRTQFADAYEQYMSATTMKDRSRDSYGNLWPQIKPVLGHLFIEEVDTAAMDALKRALPSRLGPKSVNNRLALVRAILRFCWKRGLLATVPYVPTERTPKKQPKWYSEAERDRFLAGMFELQPQWYLFFYLSARLGLRVSEVYAISKSRLRDIPPELIVDRAVQRGTKIRSAMLVTRKNNEAYTLGLAEDIVDAIRWHVRQGYAGPEFLFSKDGSFPRYIDSYGRPMVAVQRALGLRPLSHHALGRHSVASQAVTGGHSIKAVQAQLGHRSEQSTHMYAHLGSGAQLRLVEALQPAAAPHGTLRAPSKKKGT